MNKKNIKKLFLSIFVLCEIFLMSIPSTFAKFSAPSTQSVLREIEQRYHLDPTAIQGFGEGMNVADKKGIAPEVTVLFSPRNPKKGEKITAQAIPTYFSNSKEKLYYTWYLKHDGGNTNWDGVPGVDMQDYKIEAMRTIAQGGWTPNLDTNGDGDVTDPEDFVDNADWYSSQVDDDNDGYEATLGGDGQTGSGIYEHCYLHDFKGGLDHELAESRGGGQVTWGACAGTRVCAIEENGIGEPTLSINPITGGGCIPVFPDTNCSGISGGGSSGDWFVETPECVATGATPYCDNGSVVCASGTPRCATNLAVDGTLGEAACNTFPGLSCTGGGNFDTTCNLYDPYGAAEPVDQRHLFAIGRDPGTNEPRVIGAADGTFTLTDEEFWGTNPNDADTAGNGYSDEATIAGLAQDTISWVYRAGDEIGVVIEGTSLGPTKYTEGSNKVMWAFTKNVCEPTGKSEIRITAPYNPSVPTTTKNIHNCLADNFLNPAAGDSEEMELDLSAFPEDAINDPSGDNMGDVIFANAALSNSSRDSKEINYLWKVSYCSNGSFSCNGGVWVDITSFLKTSGFIDGGYIGNGLSEFNFKLGIVSGDPTLLPAGQYDNAFPVANGRVGHFKIEVTATEDYGSGSRQARGTIIKRIVSTTEKINAHRVSIEPNTITPPRPYTLDIIPGNLCVTDLLEKSICYVVQNEIIGLTINPNIDGVGGDDLNNYNWTIDGEPLLCDTSVAVAPICEDNGATETNFFPVTKEAGESYTIGLTAINTVNGQKVNMVRKFEVVEPFILIESVTDTSWPKLVGSYTDIDNGIFYPDYSKTIFNTVSGNAVSLVAEFHPPFIQPDCTTEWLLDGLRDGETSDITLVSDTTSYPPPFNPAAGVIDTLDFNVNKEGGEAYNVQFDAMCNKLPEYRNAVMDIWDISQFGTGDQIISSKIQQEVIAASTSTKGPVGFLANLSSNLPGHIMFLLRVALTVFVLLSISRLVFSLGSGIAGESRENR